MCVFIHSGIPGELLHKEEHDDDEMNIDLTDSPV